MSLQAIMYGFGLFFRPTLHQCIFFLYVQIAFMENRFHRTWMVSASGSCHCQGLGFGLGAVSLASSPTKVPGAVSYNRVCAALRDSCRVLRVRSDVLLSGRVLRVRSDVLLLSGRCRTLPYAADRA